MGKSDIVTLRSALIGNVFHLNRFLFLALHVNLEEINEQKEEEDVSWKSVHSWRNLFYGTLSLRDCYCFIQGIYPRS